MSKRPWYHSSSRYCQTPSGYCCSAASRRCASKRVGTAWDVRPATGRLLLQLSGEVAKKALEHMLARGKCERDIVRSRLRRSLVSHSETPTSVSREGKGQRPPVGPA